LVAVVILANLLKYPAFSFGPRYAAATGVSLVEGYRRQGWWALALYGLLTVGTMFTVQAAVTLLTAALAEAAFGLGGHTFELALALTVGCGVIVGVGRYRWLDRIMKVVVVLLTVQTLVATILVLPRIQWSSLAVFPSGLVADASGLFFVAALVGWMPSAIDISVWHSLWTLAKSRSRGERATVDGALFDFNVGYVGTAALAICFILLGAGVIHAADPRPVLETSAGKFAVQVLGLYTDVLGEWSAPLIGGCAVLVMFSTVLTVVDGFPRALSALALRCRRAEEPWADSEELSHNIYWAALALLAAGSLVIVRWFKKDLGGLVDLATTLSFLTAPALAALNHRAMTGPDIGGEHRPGRVMIGYSAVSIASLLLMATLWLKVRFF
jgi:Mn2+/Fe2+ NRAMP family transporter